MSSKNFIGGFLLGAGIGVVAGILLAPEKGSDTLKKLSNAVQNNINHLKGDAEDWADDVKSKGEDIVNSGSNKAKELLQDGKEKIDTFKNKADKAIL